MRGLARSLADLCFQDHVAFLYETEEHHRAVVSAFVRQGIERGARVVYIACGRPAEAALADLCAAGLPVEPCLAQGQLAIVDTGEAYLRDGTFDPEATLALLRQEIARALQEGYTGLYVTGEMAWALEGRPGSERLATYEQQVDALFPGSACVGLCQYDRRRFDPGLLLQVLPAHPIVIVGTEVYREARHVPPPASDHCSPATLLDRWLGELAARQQASPADSSEPPDSPPPQTRPSPRGCTVAQRMQRVMAHRLAVEEALAQASALLAADEAADLTHVLAILGQAVGASRAYIFRFRNDARRADNTHEWCAPGVAPQMANLQDIDSAPLTWWMGKLRRNEEIAISDLARLPAEAAAERRILEPQGIRALLVVPMFSRGQLTGFLGFDDTWKTRQWPPEDTRLLRTAAEILAAHEERRRAAEALAFLAEASRVLAGSLDYEATLQSVARLCLPTLADWCLVDIAASDSTPRQAVYAHADPAREPLIAILSQYYPPRPDGPHPASQVERSGQWVIRSEISDEDWAAVAPDERFLGIMRQLQMRSGLVVPLVARGRVIGSISLASTRPHRYGAPDLALAEDLARRCALAVDNARLYREAQQAIKARDDFLSVAAHELKTPITGLRGFAQLTLQRLRRGAVEPQQVQQALEIIDQQANKLSRLVAQLLDVSRIEAGQLRLERHATDLAALVDSAVAVAHARHSEQRIVVRTTPVTAFVDSLRLEQVLDNLLDNACKFNRSDLPIEVDLTAAGDTISVAVRDHGLGIAPEQRRRIFERFATEAGHATGGMGLGLFIANHIVALHGGSIEVDCPPDGGARFVVELPAGVEARPRGME